MRSSALRSKLEKAGAPLTHRRCKTRGPSRSTRKAQASSARAGNQVEALRRVLGAILRDINTRRPTHDVALLPSEAQAGGGMRAGVRRTKRCLLLGTTFPSGGFYIVSLSSPRAWCTRVVFCGIARKTQNKVGSWTVPVDGGGGQCACRLRLPLASSQPVDGWCRAAI